MGKKKYPCQKICRNGAEGCGMENVEECVRFLPLEGTNLIDIKGVVEIPPNVDSFKFSQYFMNWIEFMGWSFCGSFVEHKEKD